MHRTCLGALIFVWGFTLAEAARENLPSGVILISIDGGKPASIHASKMPSLDKILNEAAFSWSAQTISPSLTLPSHVSMLTGLDPKNHRVLWNDWLPEMGLLNSPTIFSISKLSGKTSHVFCSKEKFKHFFDPTVIKHFEIEDVDAKTLAEKAMPLFKQELPDILFLHFKDADLSGHLHGWESKEQLLALETVDKALGHISKSILSLKSKKNYTIIITADHGGHEKTHGTLKPDDMTIPWIAWGHKVKHGLLKTSISTKDTAATVLHLLSVPIPNQMNGKIVKEAFQK